MDIAESVPEKADGAPASPFLRIKALEFMKFFPRYIDLSKDATQEPPPDILSLVYGEYCAAAVGVLPHGVAAALSRQNKAQLQQPA